MSLNTSVQEAIYQAVSPTIYPPEVYASYYDTGYCIYNNVTYSHRVDVPGAQRAGGEARGRPGGKRALA